MEVIMIKPGVDYSGLLPFTPSGRALLVQSLRPAALFSGLLPFTPSGRALLVQSLRPAALFSGLLPFGHCCAVFKFVPADLSQPSAF